MRTAIVSAMQEELAAVLALLPDERKQALGITDNLVRLSVGVEDVADLRADLAQALRG